jgi:hypothetical protein
VLLTVSQTTGTRVYNEVLTGLVNGTNTVFTTGADFEAGNEAVYFNGVRQMEGVGCDYVRSESGGAGTGYDTITLANAPRSRPGPKTDDAVTIDYDPA